MFNNNFFNGSSNSIQINGNTITTVGNKLIIDGQEIDLNKPQQIINITIDGDVENLDVPVVGTLNIQGDCKSVEVTNGSINIQGNVSGDVQTVNGSIKANSILGKCSTVNGSIKTN